MRAALRWTCGWLTTPTPTRRTFSVVAPVVGVLLIVAGLTLPALAWPVSQPARKRWEARSYKALGPLWNELVEVSPDIVLTSTGTGEGAEADSDFMLHRRVIEINDGILTLRAYRSGRVQQATRHALAQLDEADALRGRATVEAAVSRTPSGPGTAACDPTATSPGRHPAPMNARATSGPRPSGCCLSRRRTPTATRYARPPMRPHK
ncbi:MAB_1171c family putative transporter [Streptomyces sp. NPDC020379]|uniref:MAB_1171c family putative transporter n=1 Tax=Streptomyces sp. NPDC020379 TaxID=3365071 RepID=UPI0037B3129C